ncbi:MAG: SDR family oxidoreductase [Spirochaetaceae bacterium]|nr:MAG: SDR family oxidoreductase [Spirochaetaceae bacterium]
MSVPSAPEQRTALVTGAAGTMGRAATQGLLADGVRVAMADISLEALETVRNELAAKAPAERLYPIAFDISDPEACSHAVEKIGDEFGFIDILVNNAGILSKNKIADTTPEEWHKVFAVNLDGAFYLCKACLPSMRQRKWGRIINICSFAAKSGGITAGTAYSVSKSAMIGLTFSLAAETTATGITVNGIAPAYVKTPMVTEQLSEEERQAVIAKIPVGRYCEPEEFAHVVRFLASTLAGFITGEIIDQNGGLQFD